MTKPFLVLLPGSLCDAGVWSHQVAAFSDRWQIGVPHAPQFDSLEGLAQNALAAAPQSFALAGFSMGGRVALEMMRIAPERIERLALISASVHPIGEGEGQKRQVQIDLAFNEGMPALAKSWLPRLVPESRRGDAELMDKLTAMACHFTPEDYAREVHALLNRPDARPVLSAVTCPTLILAGREDPLSTPERNREMAALAPHARLVTFDSCGHFPMLELTEATNSELVRWLTQR